MSALVGDLIPIVDQSSTITNNLRFSGQYFYQETNTYHNYSRSYDPTNGRYGQSDLIGLRGGINLHLWAPRKTLYFAEIFVASR